MIATKVVTTRTMPLVKLMTAAVPSLTTSAHAAWGWRGGWGWGGLGLGLLLELRDSYYAWSWLLDHVNYYRFADRLLPHFLPRSFLHCRALGLRPGNCSLCRFRRLRYLGCLTAFGWVSSLPFGALLDFWSLLSFSHDRPLWCSVTIQPSKARQVSNCGLSTDRSWARCSRRYTSVVLCHLRSEPMRESRRQNCMQHGDRPETPYNGKKRRLAVQTVASLSVSKLWLDGSRLAVMHADNDSLGVRSASVSGSDTEGRPSWSPPVRQTNFLHRVAQ